MGGKQPEFKGHRLRKNSIQEIFHRLGVIYQTINRQIELTGKSLTRLDTETLTDTIYNG